MLVGPVFWFDEDDGSGTGERLTRVLCARESGTMGWRRSDSSCDVGGIVDDVDDVKDSVWGPDQKEEAKSGRVG
jgi:hypothetical protein